MSPFDFAKKASELGFEGIEYVSQLYTNEIEKLGFEVVIDSLKNESEKHGIKNVLIMVDGEGDLASLDESERNESVEKHKKWVDAAKTLGCHAIRVNLFGTNDAKIWIETAVDGLTRLSDYAATKNINVLVENHGWLSSDVPVLMKVINAVGKSNCGTLPDFGNWCIKRPEGVRWGECLEEYPDKYEGVQLMMTAAKAVSAKSYDFDTNGNETTIDYVKMLQIVKDAGYKGFIGVEYEGSRLSEEEGVITTKKLLLVASKKLN
jgi:sugar phosphate isomerase/epimerase